MNINTDSNIFWMDDPSIYLRNDNYLNFIPDSKMTRAEQLNSITLFFIYTIALLIIFGKDTRWLYFPIIGIVLIVIFYNIYKIDPNGQKKELYRQKGQRFEEMSEKSDNAIESGYYDFDGNLRIGSENTHTKKHKKNIDYTLNEMREYQKAVCRKPTSDNPFMNPPVTDFNDGDKPSACNADDDDIKDNIHAGFNTDLYRDLQDLYDTKNSQRQFYTVPVTSIPSDQDAFAKWLYKTNENCKEDNERCMTTLHEDLRYKR